MVQVSSLAMIISFRPAALALNLPVVLGAWYSILEYEVDVPPLVGILALSCCEICGVPH